MMIRMYHSFLNQKIIVRNDNKSITQTEQGIMMKKQELLLFDSDKENDLNTGNSCLSNIADCLVNANTIPAVVNKLIEYLSTAFHEEDACFYYYNDYEKNIIFYRKINGILDAKAIRDDQLSTRLKQINKPGIKKRAISLRKNITTIVFPFKLSKSIRYLIEIPIKQLTSDLDLILRDLNRLRPILILALKNAYLKDQLDFQAKETIKILNSSPSGVISINKRGIVVFVNQMFEMMTGYSLEELRSSSLLMNQIFPEFSFLILEGRIMDGKIYYLRRRDGSEFPCFASITQVTEDDEITLILTLNDASYSLRQTEEITNLRKVIADEDNVGAALFRFAAFGGELIKEDLRNIDLEADYFSTMCYTSIAQGNSQITGVFGPIPAPKIPNYRAIIFAFFGKDDIQLDPRMKGRQYYLVAVIFPNSKTEFLIPNKSIDKRFREYLNRFEYPNRMTKQDLAYFREIVFVDEEGES